MLSSINSDNTFDNSFKFVLHYAYFTLKVNFEVLNEFRMIMSNITAFFTKLLRSRIT